MPVTARMVVTLDDEAVDHILVTALDSAHGGSHYWIREEDDLIEYDVTRAPVPVPFEGDAVMWVSASFCWRGADLEQIVGKDELEKAWNTILADEHLSKTQAAEYLRLVVTDPEGGLGHLDAEAADVLLQVALFGEITYG